MGKRCWIRCWILIWTGWWVRSENIIWWKWKWKPTEVWIQRYLENQCEKKKKIWQTRSFCRNIIAGTREFVWPYVLVSIPDNANEMMDVVLEDLLSDIDQGIAELLDSQRCRLNRNTMSHGCSLTQDSLHQCRVWQWPKDFIRIPDGSQVLLASL